MGISDFSWGKVEVAGLGTFKDVKLWPAGGREWDWSETGTRHRPGIQPEDVDELLENGAEIVLLSRGVDLVLQTMPDTLAYLEAKGVPFEQLQSEEAVERYNELLEKGIAVGLLLHSTC